MCDRTKREKVREGNCSVYSGIVPPRAGAGATWKLSPFGFQAAGEKLSVLNILEKKKREMVN